MRGLAGCGLLKALPLPGCVGSSRPLTRGASVSSSAQGGAGAGWHPRALPSPVISLFQGMAPPRTAEFTFWKGRENKNVNYLCFKRKLGQSLLCGIVFCQLPQCVPCFGTKIALSLSIDSNCFLPAKCFFFFLFMFFFLRIDICME